MYFLFEKLNVFETPLGITGLAYRPTLLKLPESYNLPGKLPRNFENFNYSETEKIKFQTGPEKWRSRATLPQ